MKKLLALLLVGMMIFSLAACGDNNTTDPDKDNPGVSQSGENNNGGEENKDDIKYVMTFKESTNPNPNSNFAHAASSSLSATLYSGINVSSASLSVRLLGWFQK